MRASAQRWFSTETQWGAESDVRERPVNGQPVREVLIPAGFRQGPAGRRRDPMPSSEGPAWTTTGIEPASLIRMRFQAVVESENLEIAAADLVGAYALRSP